MIGQAQSKFELDYFRVNIETMDPDIAFSFDFTGDPNVAAINYGIDVTDHNNFPASISSQAVNNWHSPSNGSACPRCSPANFPPIQLSIPSPRYPAYKRRGYDN